MKKLAVVLDVLVVFTVAMLTAGCATTRAQAPGPRPALEVPPVPPRMIEPAPAPVPPEPEPVGALPTPPPPTAKPRPQPRDTPPRDTQKPDPKPAETPAPEQTTGNAQPPAATVPPLRTARTGDAAQAERQIRDVLGRASGTLARVDYRRLTSERKKAYDQAKQFIEGAEAALKESNFEAAREFADKAETFAKQLQG
jgi:outer membrane biosynthesis protein TonB